MIIYRLNLFVNFVDQVFWRVTGNYFLFIQNFVLFAIVKPFKFSFSFTPAYRTQDIFFPLLDEVYRLHLGVKISVS